MKKEDIKKIINLLLKMFIIILFISYTTIYITQKTSYYEYFNHKQVVLTSEKIKQFESDVANGKDISIESYYETVNKDYSNNASNFGKKVSQVIGDYTVSGIKWLFRKLNKILEE